VRHCPADSFVEVQRLTSGTTIGPVEVTLSIADVENIGEESAHRLGRPVH